MTDIITTTSTDQTDDHALTGPAHVAAEVLASAFFDDPVFRWCLPEPARRAEVLPGFFELVSAATWPLGESEVTVDARGAALWIPPGEPAVAEVHAATFEARVADLVGVDGQRTFAIMALLDGHHPTEPHRFLWFLGVRPEAQGRGIGSTLLGAMLARCDRERTPAYLDATSEHNRRLYQRHGFEVIAERSVAGSPPLWAMWREPRARAGR